jgi:muramoyltetrapeptide carboxypeptidase
LKPLKPPPLRAGDKIGIVASAGAVEGELLRQGSNAIVQAGFHVELAQGILERKGYLAGDKSLRTKALQDFFCRPDIKAIFCARGGFGSVQLLPLLNAETIKRHPKIFVGYSDVSILLNWFLQQCGMVTFHGPMVAKELARGLEGRNRDFFWDTLLGKNSQWKIETGEAIRPGTAEAPLVGGCLSAIVTTLGTPYEIGTAGKILFLEDVGEKPYRIERMLTHLQMAGKLEGIAGVILGDFVECEGEGEVGLQQIFKEFFRKVSYPVVSGLAAGHGEVNLLLPFGVTMALNGKAGILSLLESPVAQL